MLSLKQLNLQTMYQNQENQKQQLQEEIPQLRQLEREIREKRPNNIMKFIRTWATQHFTFNKYSSDEEEEDFLKQKILRKHTKRKRRNAVLGYLKNQKQDKQEKEEKEKQKQKIKQNKGQQIKKTQKSEESKSIIMILLKQLKILSLLSDESLNQLVELAQIKKYSKQNVICDKGASVQGLFIIISGLVIIEEKYIMIEAGSAFGQESILYPIQSSQKYMTEEKSQIAYIKSLDIWKKIRQTAELKYKYIMSSLLTIEMFKDLDNEELDKIANLAMTEKGMFTSSHEQILKEGENENFYIVIEGQFGQYSRKLTGVLKKEPIRKLQAGDVFGAQILRNNGSIDYTVISHESGKVMKFRKVDVERIIGELILVEKRRKRQKQF